MSPCIVLSLFLLTTFLNYEDIGPGKNTAKAAMRVLMCSALRYRLYKAAKITSLRDCYSFSKEKHTVSNTQV